MKPRRFVTGLDEHGEAVFAAAGEAPRLGVASSYEIFSIWGSDAPPRLGEAEQPASATVFPPSGGVRVSVSDLPAEPEPFDLAAHLHRSDTIDFCFVLAGRPILIQGDGTEQQLEPGDSIVQTGTDHAWHNPGPAPARIAFVLLGVEPGVEPD